MKPLAAGTFSATLRATKEEALPGKRIAPSAPDLIDELVDRSVRMIMPQTRASTPVALFVAAMYGFIYVPAVGWRAYGAWYVAVAAAFIGRQVYFEWLLARHGTTPRSLFLIALVSAFAGWVSTLSIALFSRYLSIADLGVLTIIMVGTVTVAVSILCVQPKVYLAYVIVCFINVFVGWAWKAEARDLLFIGVSLVLGGTLLVRLGTLLATQLRETVEISMRNVELVAQLRRALDNEQDVRRARSRFLGAASHDLRQPVQALLFLIDLFRNAAVQPAQRDLASQIVRTAESIDAMFRHLVDYAQIDAGTLKAEMQPVHLQRLLQSAVSGFEEKCREKGLSFRLQPGEPLTVSADPVLLERLLRNFLDNARKYSRAGEINLAAWRDADSAVVEVRDQGVGMDASDLDQAFNAFFRGRSAALAEAEGIGLGLAICKHMAAEMGATLELESRPDVGTRVTIRLNIVCEPQAKRDPKPGRPVLDGLRILVLEDDRIAREALALWLESAGATIAAAACLKDLLPQLDGFGPVDFIVADYRLSEGDGAAAIHELRRRYGKVAAIVLSGERSIAGIDRALHVMQKPVSPERLLEGIAAAAGRRAKEEEANGQVEV